MLFLQTLKAAWINERFGPTWGENPFSIGVSPANPTFAMLPISAEL
jgi:hypothetical protein